MDEMIGFVTGNKNRKKLLALLGSKGGMDGVSLAKNMHIVKPSVDTIVAELLNKELINEHNGIYTLTELGASVERSVHSI